jgi:cellulose synthase/poly-beta-1,6-N-acetylglucosamine synthase-like glycosyltransferase
MTSHTGELLTLLVYYVVLSVLAVYGAHRGWIVWLYYRHRGRLPRADPDLAALPRVTVQLPIYNEVYVVERLIRAVAAFQYPRSLLEIQILDDSTDETREIARETAASLTRLGFDIVHLPRAKRDGFKAGALQAGLSAASGDYLAIFDADFVPPPDFLRRCLPHFADPGVGMVQARWDHLNRDFSLLTRIQTILLDGHFVIEHTARHRSGRFFNFNGTAGIWRRTCLEDSGGWMADTLTEDLDLSYRAQLRGWRFVYLSDCMAPAEVPVEIHGFKSQQRRWAKGSIQTGRKLLPAILRSRFSPRIKAEAFFHLTNNVSYLLVLALSLLMVPAIVIRDRIGWQKLVALDLPLFLAGSVSFLVFYVCSQRELGRGWWTTLRCLPALLSLGIGLSVSNSRAVLEALLDRPTDFVRTPKYSIEGTRGEWRSKRYRAARDASLVGELLLAVYFLVAIAVAVRDRYWASLPFLLVFFNGYAYTAGLSLTSMWSSRRRSASAFGLSRAAIG